MLIYEDVLQKIKILFKIAFDTILYERSHYLLQGYMQSTRYIHIKVGLTLQCQKVYLSCEL